MNITNEKENKTIKSLKRLKDKKYRNEKGIFFIEGLRFVREALREKANIRSIILSETFNKKLMIEKLCPDIRNLDNLEKLIIPDKLFNKLCDTKTPQGILALVELEFINIKEILKRDGFIAILESIQDPGNLGTIIRTADAAGAAGVVVSKGCVDSRCPKVLRSTMGAIFRVPICYSDDILETLDFIKANGVKIYASDLQSKNSYFDVKFSCNCGIIIGSESNGITQDVKNLADMTIRIPMSQGAESLNASVAAALLMYEIVRQNI